jgi:hypothetical protein
MNSSDKEQNSKPNPSDKSATKKPVQEEKYTDNADQAEGERGGGTSSKVGRTPGKAEGSRNPANQDEK